MIKRCAFAAATLLMLPGCIRCSRDARGSAREKLEALAYFATSPAEDDFVGVRVNVPEKTYPGVTLYIHHPSGELHFIDMEGKIVRKIDVEEQLKKIEHPDRDFFLSKTHELLLAKPYDASSLLLLFESFGLARMRWDGTIMWLHKRRFHHDFHVDPDGKIHALSLEKVKAPAFSQEMPVLDNCIVQLTAEGKIVDQLCMLDMFEKVPAAKKAIVEQPEYFHYYEEDSWDALHANSITRATEDIADASGKKVVARGDFLVCVRHADMIFVIDPVNKAVRWSWGKGEIEYPHHATFVGNGKILLFDNGSHRKWSRVIEVDPTTNGITWEYRREPKESFFSNSRSSVQRLPNGNTLITDSGQGEVFELDQTKEVVWKFHGPIVHKDNGDPHRVALYRAYRFDRTQFAFDAVTSR